MRPASGDAETWMLRRKRLQVLEQLHVVRPEKFANQHRQPGNLSVCNPLLYRLGVAAVQGQRRDPEMPAASELAQQRSNRVSQVISAAEQPVQGLARAWDVGEDSGHGLLQLGEALAWSAGRSNGAGTVSPSSAWASASASSGGRSGGASNMALKSGISYLRLCSTCLSSDAH